MSLFWSTMLVWPVVASSSALRPPASCHPPLVTLAVALDEAYQLGVDAPCMPPMVDRVKGLPEAHKGSVHGCSMGSGELPSSINQQRLLDEASRQSAVPLPPWKPCCACCMCFSMSRQRRRRRSMHHIAMLSSPMLVRLPHPLPL